MDTSHCAIFDVTLVFFNLTFDSVSVANSTKLIPLITSAIYCGIGFWLCWAVISVMSRWLEGTLSIVLCGATAQNGPGPLHCRNFWITHTHTTHMHTYTHTTHTHTYPNTHHTHIHTPHTNTPHTHTHTQAHAFTEVLLSIASLLGHKFVLGKTSWKIV